MHWTCTIACRLEVNSLFDHFREFCDPAPLLISGFCINWLAPWFRGKSSLYLISDPNKSLIGYYFCPNWESHNHHMLDLLSYRQILMYIWNIN